MLIACLITCFDFILLFSPFYPPNHTQKTAWRTGILPMSSLASSHLYLNILSSLKYSLNLKVMFSDFLNKIKIFRFSGFVQSSFPSGSRRNFKFIAGRFKFTCFSGQFGTFENGPSTLNLQCSHEMISRIRRTFTTSSLFQILKIQYFYTLFTTF